MVLLMCLGWCAQHGIGVVGCSGVLTAANVSCCGAGSLVQGSRTVRSFGVLSWCAFGVFSRFWRFLPAPTSYTYMHTSTKTSCLPSFLPWRTRCYRGDPLLPGETRCCQGTRALMTYTVIYWLVEQYNGALSLGV